MPDLNEDERKRLEAVNELISTESRYQTRLRTIQYKFLELSKLILKEDDLSVVFQNVPELVTCSQTLQTALKSAGPDSIGAVFQSKMIHFAELKRYCLGHAEANSRLQELLKTHKPFIKLTSEIQELPECESLDLASFLLEPVQRLTRYSLLLRQILHYTSKDHPDHSATVQSLNESELFLRETNEEVRAKENLIILRDFQNRLEKGLLKRKHGLSGLFGRSQDKMKEITEKVPFNLVSETKNGSPRCLIHSGEAILAIPKKLCEIFLFNDSLMVARPHSDKSLELIETLFPADNVQIEHSFLANELTLRFEDTRVSLLFEDEDDVDLWKHEIKAVQKNLAKSAMRKTFIKPQMQSFIGSASIKILSATGISQTGVATVCNLKIGFHDSSTAEKYGPDPLWGESVILPVPHLQEDLEISLYSLQKFAPKEYYANKETDVIEVKLVGASGHETGGKVLLQIAYKPF